MAPKYKRRNYFIDPDIQGSFIWETFLLVLFCWILYGFILAYFSNDYITITYKDNNLLIGKTPIILFKEMLKAQGTFMLSGGVGFVIFALLISHRIAGPLFKLHNTMQLLLEHDHSFSIRFRPKDKGYELGNVINHYNQNISREISEMRADTAALEEKLALLDASVPESAKMAISEALQIVNQLQAKLQIYKLQTIDAPEPRS